MDGQAFANRQCWNSPTFLRLNRATSSKSLRPVHRTEKRDQCTVSLIYEAETTIGQQTECRVSSNDCKGQEKGRRMHFEATISRIIRKPRTPPMMFGGSSMLGCHRQEKDKLSAFSQIPGDQQNLFLVFVF